MCIYCGTIQFLVGKFFYCVLNNSIGCTCEAFPLYQLTGLPAIKDLKATMNLEQNQVVLKWTLPNARSLSSKLKLSYRLFYTARGVCAASKCQFTRCRVEKRIRARFTGVRINQELFPFTNYMWLLELTYSNNGSTIDKFNISVNIQTNQSSELLVLDATPYMMSSCIYIILIIITYL